MYRRNDQREHYLTNIFTGRRWKKSFSTWRLLLVIALVIAGVWLVTWYLFAIKGGE